MDIQKLRDVLLRVECLKLELESVNSSLSELNDGPIFDIQDIPLIIEGLRYDVRQYEALTRLEQIKIKVDEFNSKCEFAITYTRSIPSLLARLKSRGDQMEANLLEHIEYELHCINETLEENPRRRRSVIEHVDAIPRHIDMLKDDLSRREI